MINNYTTQQSAVEHIRPHQVLSIGDGFDDRINFFMPQAQGQGSLSTIEAIILIKLMRIVNAAYIFEFGTYRGLTTRILLENLPPHDVDGERIFTLDLPAIDGINFQGSDLEVAKQSINFQRKYLSSSNKKDVKQILQDCLTLDESLYSNKFQLIFIDGNHEVNYVRSDTEKSFVMLSDSPSCIAWHDYGNPEFPELTNYIDGLAKNIDIFHIEGTMLAFHLKGKEIPSRNY